MKLEELNKSEINSIQKPRFLVLSPKTQEDKKKISSAQKRLNKAIKALCTAQERIRDLTIDKQYWLDSFFDFSESYEYEKLIAKILPSLISGDDWRPAHLPGDAEFPIRSNYSDPNEYYKAAAIALIKLKIKAADDLAKIFNRVLYSLESERLPAPVPLGATNFITNNKLPAPDEEHSKLVKTRLSISIAEDLANTLDIMDKEMATILTISIRTYHRLKPNGLLNPVASERLILLKELAVYGLEVFEDQQKFNKWLRQPIPGLSNLSPLNSLDTATGFNLVKTILGRIEYGVYS